MDKGLITHLVILNEKKEMLILRRSLEEDVLPGYWDVPGGTLKDGEDPREGALRETREEAGINIDDLSLFYHTSNVDVGKNKQFVRMIFIGSYSNNDVILNPEEHIDYEWVDINNIDKEKELVDYLYDIINILKEKRHILFHI
ncbi:MAG: NUDIX hydrolase [Patescibacteria group bacterium]|jgi:8-oxo-dGTP pyrophosphatase MutT (NUDIX family)|nr:NUDIX hydrolase [Patescibacteria group bacterium]